MQPIPRRIRLTRPPKGAVGDVSMVVRVAVAGRQNAPDLQTVMGILGREHVLDRLEKCKKEL